LWVLASSVGFGVGVLVAVGMYIFEVYASIIDLGGMVYPAVFGIVFGAPVGIAQWLVLRWDVTRAGWWVLASIVGLAVGMGVAEVVDSATDLGGAVVGAVVGASVGIAQWLVLRRQVARAGWWVLASSVGLAATFLALSGFAAVCSPVFYVVFSGIVLAWLLLQPVKEEPSLPKDAG
jgi:hypothetical protein